MPNNDQQPTETPGFPNAIACEHGRLRRSCNECFLQSELASAHAEIARLVDAGNALSGCLQAYASPSYGGCECIDCQALATWESLKK